MANVDLLRTNGGMPNLPDISDMDDSQKVEVLYRYSRSLQDYIVRLKDQIGYELKTKNGG
jgi:hypothetical protein